MVDWGVFTRVFDWGRLEFTVKLGLLFASGCKEGGPEWLVDGGWVDSSGNNEFMSSPELVEFVEVDSWGEVVPFSLTSSFSFLISFCTFSCWLLFFSIWIESSFFGLPLLNFFLFCWIYLFIIYWFIFFKKKERNKIRK